MPKKPTKKKLPRKGAAASLAHIASYVHSPEHKTHPGPWGTPQWRRREPQLSPCPTDLDHALPQLWLDAALRAPFCWDPGDEEGAISDRYPLYIYWFDDDRQQFFIGQRLQRSWVAAQQFTYKGYPVEDADVPRAIVDRFHEQGLLDDEARDRLRRARRARHGAKP